MIVKIAMSIALIFILSACKGGAGNKTDSEDKKLLVGYYIDSPVMGLEYDCNTNKGKTDSDGKFQFEAGESCTFYLGNKAMRSIDKDKLFNGVKIFEKNLKIASILQTLDADGNASNGIEIPSGADICMGKSIHDTNVSQLHSCLKKSILEYSGTEVNETKAKEHLEDTEKRYNPTTNITIMENNSINITLSDKNINSDNLTYVITKNPSHGKLIGIAPNLTYTPNFDFSGSDSFSYRVNDGVVQNVVIRVINVNNVPVPTFLTLTTQEDKIKRGTLTATDDDNDTLTFTITTKPQNGTLSLEANGNFSYTPNQNFNGSDSFSYKVNDGTDDSVVQSVAITVTAVNDRPVPTFTTLTVQEDTTKTATLTATDDDNDTLTFSVVMKPQDGILILDENGTFVYTPNHNFNGIDSFAYKVNDSKDYSIEKNVTIVVTNVNDAPVATFTTLTNVKEDSTKFETLTAADVDGNSLIFSVVVRPQNGTLNLEANGSFSYRTDSNYKGMDYFTYRVFDGKSYSAEQNVTITVNSTTDAPIPTFRSFVTIEDTIKTAILTAGYVDNNSSLIFSLVTQPKNGTLNLESNGSFVYTPNQNFNGSDSFSYKVSDGVFDSIVQSVAITVTAVNDRPVPTFTTLTVREDIAKRAILTASDVDSNSSGLFFSEVSQPQNGILNLETNGSFIYTPNQNFNGSDSFSYKVNDGTDDSVVQSVAITVTAVNDRPTPTFTTLTVQEDSSKTTILTATDVDNDTFTFSIVTKPQNGILILDENGSFTYTPNPNFNGSDYFAYIANDGTLNSLEQNVTIRVTSINDAPVASDINISTNENRSVDITLKASDIDSNNIAYTITNNPEHGSLKISNNIATYRPNNNFFGSDSFSYKANDGNTTSNEAIVLINVTPINIYITEDYKVIPLNNNRTINKKIYLESSAKNLYLVFSNTNEANSSQATLNHSNKVAMQKNYLFKSIIKNSSKIKPAPAHVTYFNNHALEHIKSKKNINKNIITAPKSFSKLPSVGDVDIFYLEQNLSVEINATLKKVVSKVKTKFGEKTLNIWVSDNSFRDNVSKSCKKVACLTQDMIDDLADNFLKTGDNNDIYDWVTNIYGEEWGSEPSSTYTNFIEQNNTIDILLFDIDNDNSLNGGTVGYFYAKDNFKSSDINGSNERIMFYVDSVLFANPSNGFWQKAIYSTLAHEFQHMIHFYKKNLLALNDGTSKTWLNEMMSVTTEYLIATKLEYSGDRGVIYNDGSAGRKGNSDGRFSYFNDKNTITVTNWSNNIYDYAKVASFGAFLVNNYGGASLLHNMMINEYGDKQTIIDAIKSTKGVDVTFGELLQKWGIAVMLSDHDNLDDDTPKYNTGDFTINSYGGIDYKMGSINFFNYDPKPTIFAGDKNITINPHANYYYKIGENISSNLVELNITLDANTKAVLIAK